MSMNEVNCMNERIKKLIKPLVLIAAAIFAICWFIKKPGSFGDYSSYIGYAISGVSILFVVYEKWLWRFIPWNRPPVFNEQYDGSISYEFNGQKSEKELTIYVKQTWLSVEITTRTDINTSYTITGVIVQEHRADVLYYTYVTDPSALHERENPTQRGTCRMVLNGDMDNLKGKYWTSSCTVGDIEWRKRS